MSQFVVSARKYRPLRFQDVVGQEHVTATLKNALNTDKLAHAFLFCGPRGVGKTSCARILAKAINCMNPSSDREPCNECASCESFNENASFNIIELDAASNNKVEHIRQLNEQVRFQPQQGKFKVFIIDEVHMLTTAAFNAFLKTLEEPPPYAVFILATTEKHKILPTILSRCQVFDFHRIQVPAMAAHLGKIAQEEGLQAEEEALRLIASKADGALRDALSLFDRIATVSQGKIDYKMVIDQLNILDYDYFFQFVDGFLQEDLSAVMNLYDEVLSKGFDGDLFIVGLADHLRQLLVAQHPATHGLIEGGEKLKARYLEQAKKTSKGFLLTGLSLLNDCDVQYPRARHKRLHVEICLGRIAYMRRVVSPGHNSTAEKKKSDARAVEPAQQEDPSDRKPTDQEKTPEPSVKVEPSLVKESPKPIGLTSKQTITPSAPPSAKGKIPSLIPSLQSTSSLTKAVEEEIRTKEENVQELTVELVRAAWKKYGEALHSASTRNMFENSDVFLENEIIRVMVPTSIARDTLAKETAFIQSLRDEFLRSDLKVEINIDEEKAAALKASTVRPMNAKEKFEALRATNPNFQSLQTWFDLKPDGEI